VSPKSYSGIKNINETCKNPIISLSLSRLSEAPNKASKLIESYKYVDTKARNEDKFSTRHRCVYTVKLQKAENSEE
jgi:hypothetical protein